MWVIGNVDGGGRQWMRVVGGDGAGETVLDVGDCAMFVERGSAVSRARRRRHVARRTRR